MARWDFRLLGLILLCCLCDASVENVDVTIHSGTVGQVVSYNYPFVYNKDEYVIFNYRVFSNTTYPKPICLMFHRFEMLDGSTLTIRGSETGTYCEHGERIYASSSIFPLDVWSSDFFCVPLAYGEDYLKVEYAHYGQSPDVRGFQFDYWENTVHSIPNVYPTPQENSLRGKFFCFDRSSVYQHYLCDGDPNCADGTDETFAHAQCTDYRNRPMQRPGIWACDFDDGDCSSEMSSNNWETAWYIDSDEEGPRTDHTQSSSGKRGKFIYTDFDRRNYTTLPLNPGVSDYQNGYCLSFWYFMSGIDPGQLSVEWKFGNQLWQRIGSHGDKWLHGQVYLTDDYEYYGLAFEARRGSQSPARIALDDISVLPGSCQYTDGGFTSPGWKLDDCVQYSSGNNSIRCNNDKDRSMIYSPMIASGKCLVLSVRFPSRSSSGSSPYIEVWQSTLGTSPDRYIASITQFDYSDMVTTKKFTINSNNPFQMRLVIQNTRGRTVINNFYVVDNDCDHLALGRCETYQFYCSAEQCISSYKKCDGVRDCENGLDEDDCTNTVSGVTVATGLIGACIFILLGLTCVLYYVNKNATRRAEEARTNRNEELANRSQMFLIEGQGDNPGFPFDDPDYLPPSYNDCVPDGVVITPSAPPGDDSADSTSLPPYNDFLTGSFVELNPSTLTPMDQPNEHESNTICQL